MHLGVSDRLNNAIRSHDVALDNCRGEAFNYGAQAVGWRRCRVQQRTIDQATAPFHAQALRFVIGADDDRWEGQTDFRRREMTVVQARAFGGDQQGASNVGGIGFRRQSGPPRSGRAGTALCQEHDGPVGRRDGSIDPRRQRRSLCSGTAANSDMLRLAETRKLPEPLKHRDGLVGDERDERQPMAI